jgi:AcrR family transcriptional regulator
MPRPKKTETEIQAMREQILDTAYAILQTSGPEALTSRAIAEQMGMAHMSLFTYFKNQAAIRAALREREMSKMRAREDRIEQHAKTQEISKVVQELLELYIDFARENPNLYRLAWVMPEIGFESQEESRQRMQATVGRLSALVKLGMERGAFEMRDPLLAAGTVLGMVNMPYILFYSGKLVNPVMRDLMVKEVLSATLTYLKKS